MRLIVQRAERDLSGEVVVPNSKYHAHRALILASLADGETRIHGLSDAGHVRYTLQALRRLGTKITIRGAECVVRGGTYHPQRDEVSVGSSGSTMYFLVGLASLAAEPVTVVGQKYFQRRPIGPLLDALAQMGVVAESRDGCPPIRVAPKRPSGGEVRISGTLSQWISGLLLLAPFATGPTSIVVEDELNERSFIDLTIRMMAQFGLEVRVAGGGRRFEVEPGQQAQPADIALPADIGSAAFGLAAAALHPSDVVLQGLTQRRAAETDHPEAELLDIVGRMGLSLDTESVPGAVRVRHDGSPLDPVRVDCRSVPDMLPVLSVLASLANGTSVLDNVAHVRLKESDRVAAMLQLNRLGARLDLRGERLVCEGVEELHGGELSSFNDHRVLMSLAVAGSRASGGTQLTYPNAYRISYPHFLDSMNTMGIPMVIRSASGASLAGRARAAPSVQRAAIRPIGERVRDWARSQPDAPAVVEVGEPADRVMTWGELDAEADKVAAVLLRLGVQPGESVAMQLPNRADFAVIALGTMRVGALCCPLMPIFRAREMTAILRGSRSRVLFVPAKFRSRDYPAEIAELLAGGNVRLAHVVALDADDDFSAAGGSAQWHGYSAELAAARVDADALRERVPGADALAQLLYTSGTSGEPKGVLHRFDALSRAAAMQAAHLGLTGDDGIFIPSPLAHQTGFLYGMWVAFLLGATQIVQPVWGAGQALRALRDYGGTFCQAATPFLGDLVKAVDEGDEPPGSLRTFVATGAAVPRGLAERAGRVLGTAVCGAWGTTESCLGSLAAPGDEPAKMWGTDGRPLSGVRIRVVDDQGRELAAGQEGNFEVSSKCLFEGYLDHPEWTKEVLTEDGWYRSGDLAVIDESGYVRISGRVKDVINRGGEKVPVAEIEQLLHANPAIEDVAIVAMPDERLGERACAFVVARDAVTLPTLREYLSQANVAKQYWPERLETLAELPRNPSGKVQKFQLRERAQELVAAERAGQAGSAA